MRSAYHRLLDVRRYPSAEYPDVPGGPVRDLHPLSVPGSTSMIALRWFPSMVMEAPCTKLAQSEARKTTTFATSCGVQIRPKAMDFFATRSASSTERFLSRANARVRLSQRPV